MHHSTLALINKGIIRAPCRAFVLLLSMVLSSCGMGEVPQSRHMEHRNSLLANKEVICIIGDSGTGDSNQHAVASALEQMNCSQIRILGDVIYPNGIKDMNDPLLKERFLVPFQYFLEHNVPIYLVMGNHDHKENASAWLDLAAKNPLIKFPYYYYSENWGNVCFFNLDTSFYDKLYYVHKRIPQTRWLQQAMLDQKDRCDFSLALGHHPYISSGSHGHASWQLGRVLKNEVFGKVDLYIAGHDHHLSDEGEIDGTRQLISGAASLLYLLGSPSATKQFAVSKHGFMTLQFKRNDEHQIVADYTFYSLTPDNKGGYTNLVREWHGQIKGQGLRLE